MSREQDLERLGHAIKDAEARLKVFAQTLEVIAKELDDLEDVRALLEENIEYLKKKNIVAMAMEFRKAKDDLARSKVKLAKVRVDRENVLKAAKEVEEYMSKAKADYASTLKGPTNVLSFRRKNAKE